MPRFNRTGPEGKGPLTGGGKGLCNPQNKDTGIRGGVGQGNAPMGGGAGRCWGGGRGRRWLEPVDSVETVQDLKAYASQLEDELKRVKEKLEVKD